MASATRPTEGGKLEWTAALFTFRYPAQVLSWYDGDTVVADVRLTPSLELHNVHVRVEGINAPELHATGGIASRDYASSLAPPGAVVTLTASRPEKYGRLLAYIQLPNGDDLSKRMIAAGQAVPFMVG